MPKINIDTEPLAKKLKEKSLTLLEEAQALQELTPRRRSQHGATLKEIGRRLGKSYTWVRRRLALLKLSKEVQQAAHEGLFTATDLDVVTGLDRSKWRRGATRILRDKKKGLKPGRNDLRHRTTRKSHEQIRQMIAYLINKGIGGLPTRLLAWCLGIVDDNLMHKEIRDLIKNNFEPTCLDGDYYDPSEENVPYPGRSEQV